jgi:hypothetical protein
LVVRGIGLDDRFDVDCRIARHVNPSVFVRRLVFDVQQTPVGSVVVSGLGIGAARRAEDQKSGHPYRPASSFTLSDHRPRLLSTDSSAGISFGTGS